MTSNDEHRAAPDEAPLPPTAAGDGPDVPPEAPAAPDETDALGALQDRHLRLAAEFDNFRKRTARERTEVWARAQADVVERLVDAIDDLSRFAHVDPATTDAKTIHDGVDLVERKFRKALEALGVRRVDAVGVPFDPKQHEAVSTQPAPAPEQDQTVGAVLEAGYLLGDLLIRPARVVVKTWGGDGAAASDGSPASSG